MRSSLGAASRRGLAPDQGFRGYHLQGARSTGLARDSKRRCRYERTRPGKSTSFGHDIRYCVRSSPSGTVDHSGPGLSAAGAQRALAIASTDSVTVQRTS